MGTAREAAASALPSGRLMPSRLRDVRAASERLGARARALRSLLLTGVLTRLRGVWARGARRVWEGAQCNKCGGGFLKLGPRDNRNVTCGCGGRTGPRGDELSPFTSTWVPAAVQAPAASCNRDIMGGMSGLPQSGPFS
eukprot:363996-Chlamydomonas_euryale.AAC.6